MLGSVLCVGDMRVNKNQCPCLHGAHNLVGNIYYTSKCKTVFVASTKMDKYLVLKTVTGGFKEDHVVEVKIELSSEK